MALVLLGRIIGAHGIKGEVKIRSFTDDPKAIASYGPLQTTTGVSIEILRLKSANDHFICTLKNVKDRNGAESLKGSDLFVSRDRLPDERILADLVGKIAKYRSTVLGAVVGFQNFGAGDLLELEDGQLIPVRFIADIAETIAIELPDGFMDHPSPEEGEG